jgi:hypothetical protein
MTGCMIEEAPVRGINPPERLVFHALHDYFNQLYDTVPRPNDISNDKGNERAKYTRTVWLTPHEAVDILDAIRCHYCSDSDVNQYFIQLEKAVAHSPKRLPDEKKPRITQDAHPDIPIAHICIQIPSPTDKLHGIIMLFGRAREPQRNDLLQAILETNGPVEGYRKYNELLQGVRENKELVQTTIDNGDWIERSKVQLLFNFPHEAECYKLYDVLDDILQQRKAPHYTRSAQLRMLLQDVLEYIANADKGV